MQRSIQVTLQRLFEEAPEIRIDEGDRWVIFSDLHAGKRTRKDDFLRNSAMFMTVLREYYDDGGWSLILNGDVEDLHRYWLHEVLSAWPDLYTLFGGFAARGALIKTIGNHDIVLSLPNAGYPLEDCLREAVRLRYGEEILFVFHGHQASRVYQRFNTLGGFLLRYLVKPLGIKAYSVSRDKARKYRIESRVYDFSQGRRIASIIGHTHRPLFESLSKLDTLQFRIEQLCRSYPAAAPQERPRLSAEIRESKEELARLFENDGQGPSHRSIYHSHLLVPCLFNSGTVTGKRGMTAIEIAGGRIALVYWFDRNRGSRYLESDEYRPERLDGTDYHRVVIDEDLLGYIFTRIRLLAD